MITDKINKLTLPATIIIASLILGGFFYASQVNKQKSIERQQEIKIETEKQERLSKERGELTTKTLLDNCLYEVEQRKNESIRYWGDYENKTCVGEMDILYCYQGVLESMNEAKAEATQEKEECFKRYPQK